MKTVKDVAAEAGVSVRLLHHYDTIGLLKPTQVTQAGYRLYDEAALERLQSILLLRELRFSLSEIRTILDDPAYDRREALKHQIRLLEMQRQHLDNLIEHAKKLEKGEDYMKFSAYDKSKMKRYAEEAREKWGKTDAYREYEANHQGKSDDEEQKLGEGLMAIFTKLGAFRSGDPAAPEAQTCIGELQAYITRHYYNCTSQILKGLGQMYAAGGEMTENIDQAGGAGTAVFACRAIEIYTK